MSKASFVEFIRENRLEVRWETYAKARGEEVTLLAPFWRKAKDRPAYIDEMPATQAGQFVNSFKASLVTVPVPDPNPPTPGPCAPSVPSIDAGKRERLEAFLKETGEAFHPVLPQVLMAMLAGRDCGKIHPVYVWGPAGSGKSHMAMQACSLLGRFISKELAFFGMVAGPNFTEFDYLAKAMPKGEVPVPALAEMLPKACPDWVRKAVTWVAGLFAGMGGVRLIDAAPVLAYRQGDSFLFVDEFCLADSAANKSLNPLFEGDWLYNPATSERLLRPETLFALCAGNSNLQGPTQEYRASQPQDGSVISRFATAIFHMDYDPTMERRILDPRVSAWLISCREKLSNKGIPCEVSTRLGIRLTQELKAGYRTWDELKATWLSAQNPAAKDALK